MIHSVAFYLFFALVIVALLVGTARGFAQARRARAAAMGLPGRNPGPENSHAWAVWALQTMPDWFNRAGMWLGTTIAFLTLSRQRAASREYLRLVLGRKPTARDVWRHIHEFTRYFILRMEVCQGKEPPVRFAEGHGDELRAFLQTKKAALYGTMHVGHSDLVGFYLSHLGGRIHMIRRKVGNSGDTERLARLYEGSVSIIWINDWSRLILAMNDALRAGCSLALQCDRPEYSSKLEAFAFLGGRRMFPFTVYHLAIMHGLPVVLSFAVSDEDHPETTVVHVPPIFHPRADGARQENFAAARDHFQGFLSAIEAQLRRTPYVWFNFTPMNPLTSDEGNPPPDGRRLRLPRTATHGIPVANGSVAEVPVDARAGVEPAKVSTAA